MPRPIIKYGLTWQTHDLARIEMEMIKQGGHFMDANRHWHGKGLLHHYLELRKSIWPERYEHKWTRLIFYEILNNQIIILMGPASSQKTGCACEFALLDYWCFPETTCVLATTISGPKLEVGIWAEMKTLWSTGKSRHPWLAGISYDYLKAITTEVLDESGNMVRDLRKGIMGRSLYANRTFQGIGHYSGIKQERFRLLCDELSHCPSTLLDCLPNLRSNTGAGGLKVVGMANPKGDPDDQLGIAAEPKNGSWASVQDIDKTTCWDTKFYGGRCVNLIGVDSPNFDAPEDQPEPYPRLIGRLFAKIIKHDYGEGSFQWENQVMGRMRLGTALNRVVTRQACRENNALDPVIWMGTHRTRIYGLDPAYGGDRCVGILGEFGKDVNGNVVLLLHKPYIFKIVVSGEKDPESQIADILHDQLTEFGVPWQNCFYDSVGRGTLGYFFSHKFGGNPPIPVNSGAKPSRRPVRNDLYIFDEMRRERRLKRCDEHYVKFISELWFSFRYCVEAGQIRGLTEETMIEFCSRVYEEAPGGKLEVEPKDILKERTGKSPDLADSVAIMLEGARQRGFSIGSLSNDESADSIAWLRDIYEKRHKFTKEWTLNY